MESPWEVEFRVEDDDDVRACQQHLQQLRMELFDAADGVMQFASPSAPVAPPYQDNLPRDDAPAVSTRYDGGDDDIAVCVHADDEVRPNPPHLPPNTNTNNSTFNGSLNGVGVEQRVSFPTVPVVSSAEGVTDVLKSPKGTMMMVVSMMSHADLTQHALSSGVGSSSTSSSADVVRRLEEETSPIPPVTPSAQLTTAASIEVAAGNVSPVMLTSLSPPQRSPRSYLWGGAADATAKAPPAVIAMNNNSSVKAAAAVATIAGATTTPHSPQTTEWSRVSPATPHLQTSLSPIAVALPQQQPTGSGSPAAPSISMGDALNTATSAAATQAVQTRAKRWRFIQTPLLPQSEKAAALAALLQISDALVHRSTALIDPHHHTPRPAEEATPRSQPATKQTDSGCDDHHTNHIPNTITTAATCSPGISGTTLSAGRSDETPPPPTSVMPPSLLLSVALSSSNASDASAAASKHQLLDETSLLPPRGGQLHDIFSALTPLTQRRQWLPSGSNKPPRADAASPSYFDPPEPSINDLNSAAAVDGGEWSVSIGDRSLLCSPGKAAAYAPRDPSLHVSDTPAVVGGSAFLMEAEGSQQQPLQIADDGWVPPLRGVRVLTGATGSAYDTRNRRAAEHSTKTVSHDISAAAYASYVSPRAGVQLMRAENGSAPIATATFTDLVANESTTATTAGSGRFSVYNAQLPHAVTGTANRQNAVYVDAFASPSGRTLDMAASAQQKRPPQQRSPTRTVYDEPSQRHESPVVSPRPQLRGEPKQQQQPPPPHASLAASPSPLPAATRLGHQSIRIEQHDDGSTEVAATVMPEVTPSPTNRSRRRASLVSFLP